MFVFGIVLLLPAALALCILSTLAWLWPAIRPRRHAPSRCRACGYPRVESAPLCPECGGLYDEIVQSRPSRRVDLLNFAPLAVIWLVAIACFTPTRFSLAFSEALFEDGAVINPFVAMNLVMFLCMGPAVCRGAAPPGNDGCRGPHSLHIYPVCLWRAE